MDQIGSGIFGVTPERSSNSNIYGAFLDSSSKKGSPTELIDDFRREQAFSIDSILESTDKLSTKKTEDDSCITLAAQAVPNIGLVESPVMPKQPWLS